MAGLFEILEKIRIRPGIYLGRASVSDLFMFLEGYSTARRELGVEPTEKEMEFYGEFQPWLQKRFGIRTVNSWAKMIEFRSVNEQAAFDYFFRLLDEFLQQDRELATEQGMGETEEVNARR